MSSCASDKKKLEPFIRGSTYPPLPIRVPQEIFPPGNHPMAGAQAITPTSLAVGHTAPIPPILHPMWAAPTSVPVGSYPTIIAAPITPLNPGPPFCPIHNPGFPVVPRFPFFRCSPPVTSTVPLRRRSPRRKHPMEKAIAKQEDSTWPWPTGSIAACPHCDSTRGQWRGYRLQKNSYVRRRSCTGCGHWSFKTVAAFP